MVKASPLWQPIKIHLHVAALDCHLVVKDGEYMYDQPCVTGETHVIRIKCEAKRTTHTKK